MKLKIFAEKLTGPLSLLEFEQLLVEVKRDLPDFYDKTLSLTKEDEGLLKDLFYKRISVYKVYKYDWESEKVVPSEKELEYLKKFVNNFSSLISTFDDFKKASPSLSDDFEWAKNDVKEIKEGIEILLKNDEYRRQAEEELRRERERGGGIIFRMLISKSLTSKAKSKP